MTRYLMACTVVLLAGCSAPAPPPQASSAARGGSGGYRPGDSWRRYRASRGSGGSPGRRRCASISGTRIVGRGAGRRQPGPASTGRAGSTRRRRHRRRSRCSATSPCHPARPCRSSCGPPLASDTSTVEESVQGVLRRAAGRRRSRSGAGWRRRHRQRHRSRALGTREGPRPAGAALHVGDHRPRADANGDGVDRPGSSGDEEEGRRQDRHRRRRGRGHRRDRRRWGRARPSAPPSAARRAPAPCWPRAARKSSCASGTVLSTTLTQPLTVRVKQP